MYVVDLPGPLVLVPSPKLEASLRRARDTAWLPANAMDLVRDLNARTDGVPATLADPKPGGDRSLLVYSQTYVARLFPSRREDAHIIASIFPLRINDHRSLVHGYLLLRPRGWQFAYELARVPPAVSAHCAAIDSAWRDLMARQAAREGAPRTAAATSPTPRSATSTTTRSPACTGVSRRSRHWWSWRRTPPTAD